jgi:hypothetical protein
LNINAFEVRHAVWVISSREFAVGVSKQVKPKCITNQAEMTKNSVIIIAERIE